MDNSLTRWKKPIFKIPFSRNSKSSVWKPNFFPRQAKQKLFFFAVHSHYTGDTPYPVWFDLDNSLTRWKKPFFKIHFSRNSKSSVRKPNFFPRQAKQKIFFALHSHYTGDSPYRVWFDLDNSLTRWKKPIFKIPLSRNSKSSVWKLFPRQAKQKIFFALHSHYTGDTPYTVWFDLGNSFTRCKRIFFKILKNSQFAKLAKFRMKTQLFPRHPLPKNCLLYTLITLVILSTKFGMIWTTPWPDEKQLFLKFSKIRNSKFRRKTQLFPRNALPFFLLYTPITLVILHTPFGLIWTTP